MRRSKNSPEPASARGNFTRAADSAPAAPAEAARARHVGERTDVTAQLARTHQAERDPAHTRPVVGLVMGGFQVKSSIDTWQEAEDAEATARVVQASLTYGNRLIEERDVTAAPLLQGKKNDPTVVRPARGDGRRRGRLHAAAQNMPHKEGLDRRIDAVHRGRGAD
ncbi:hypothetical protein [Streptomyces sp. KL116D]|uniref:hypothetical protein n=1 Tax=Streptomyces sp. KL116D TaxID=3045152 RepID=UPI003556AACE